MTNVTRLLSAFGAGDPHAAEHLLPLVYDELQRYASVLPFPSALRTVPGPTLPPSEPVRGSRPPTGESVQSGHPPVAAAGRGEKPRPRRLVPLAGAAALVAVLCSTLRPRP